MKNRSGMAALAIMAALACGERRSDEPATASTHSGGPPPATSPVTATTAEVGALMPAYSAKLLDGSTFDIAKEKGNVVLLNLWATWCGPCRYEIPELEKLHHEHAQRRFKVVGVSVDEGGEQVVKEFVAEQKMTYPIVLDPEGRLATLFDSTVLPTSVIVDRTGKVVWKKFGTVTTSDREMVRALEQALKG